jgi:N-acetyl-S-(2-succino)cysteine monooxygenase
MHVLGHRGKHFMVRGPLNLARSRQGKPVLAHAAADEAGRELAAELAEIVYATPPSLEEARAFYADIKARLSRFGRESSDLKVMPTLRPIVGKTQQEAEDKYAALDALIDRSVAEKILAENALPAWTLCGTATQIADQLQERFATGAADGFSLMPASLPGGLEDFIALVIPELQRRNLFRQAYEGRFLREHLALKRPAATGSGKTAA